MRDLIQQIDEALPEGWSWLLRSAISKGEGKYFANICSPGPTLMSWNAEELRYEAPPGSDRFQTFNDDPEMALRLSFGKWVLERSQ